MSVSVYLISIFVLLSLNVALKMRSYKAPLDWDTASHLYYVLMHKSAAAFKHSYSVGIKYILPKIYSLMGFDVSGKPYHFRALNIVSSSLIILLWACVNLDCDPQDLAILVLGLLWINSMWINQMTSATEFHSSVCLLVLMILPDVVPYPYCWVLQLLVVAVMALGFKFTEIVYVVPVMFQNASNFHDNLLIVSMGLLFIMFISAYCYKSISKGTKSYSKTRKVLSIKNLYYHMASFDFIFVLACLSFLNLMNSSIAELSYLLVAGFLFIIQRNYVAYFYYPIIVVNIALALNNPFFTDSMYAGWILAIALVLAVTHLVKYVVLPNARKSYLLYRSAFKGAKDAEGALDQRDEQVEWLQSNIEKSSSVYLWGSNTALLLLSGIKHIENTFYSHNHLFLWSGIKDKSSYLKDLLEKNRPDYIVESGVIEHHSFPCGYFSKIYRLAYHLGDVKVYAKLKGT